MIIEKGELSVVPKLDAFLNHYASERTRNNYYSSIIQFCRFLGTFERSGTRITPEERGEISFLIEQYLTSEHDYGQDVEEFVRFLSIKNPKVPKPFAPQSVKLYKTAIMELLGFHKKDILSSQLRVIQKSLPKGGASARQDHLTHQIIRDLISESSFDMQTLILMLASSGMRIGEALAIRMSDVTIYPEEKCASIYLDADICKNKYSRTTCINEEALGYYQKWIATSRKKFIIQNMKQRKGIFEYHFDEDSEEIFPFNVRAARAKFVRALEKTPHYRIDERTQIRRTTLNRHSFRKFFMSNLSMAEIPDRHIFVMAGHTSELYHTYVHIPTDELIKIYLKGEKRLRIFDDSAEELQRKEIETASTNELLVQYRLNQLEANQKIANLEAQAKISSQDDINKERILKLMDMFPAIKEEADQRTRANPRS